jgi:hypothetical protein
MRPAPLPQSFVCTTVHLGVTTESLGWEAPAHAEGVRAMRTGEVKNTLLIRDI